MKKTSVPKRKKVLNKVKTTVEEKILLHLKENAFEKTLLFCQNEITWLLKNTSVPKTEVNLFLKWKITYVPKRKNTNFCT